MSISFTCDRCNVSYEVGDKMAGKTVSCRECKYQGKVPDPSAPSVTQMCPNCRRVADFPAEKDGNWVRCPACSTLMRVGAAAPAQPSRRKALLALTGGLAVVMTGVGYLFLGGRRNTRTKSEQSPRGPRPNQEPGKEGQPPRRQRKGKGGRGRGKQPMA